ncbi:hypothetical protein HFO65_15795 [Rhizobium laguerreae]|uniref:hypothetical protein n=1 Tax=Rhizobium laguerreae TaxID=1076926 RepID=UPI001C912CF2|nr:hypothetical protein [Rhizobium laguerreae]MBY3162097.1 hypothetical protein [Rhizobium laguerreae]
MTAWYEIAKPGDKIVCINDSDWGKNWLGCVTRGCLFPEKGRIYTIRIIGYSELKQHWCLRLAEIVNPSFEIPPYRPGELTFHVGRFRPLVEHKTDISLFKAMLNKAPEEVAA